MILNTSKKVNVDKTSLSMQEYALSEASKQKFNTFEFLSKTIF